MLGVDYKENGDGRGKAGVPVSPDRPDCPGGQVAYFSASTKRCASSAAMQPVPALVMAWR